jgi:hypothetical protein
MTRATRNGESDPTECTAQRLDFMRRFNGGTAAPRVAVASAVRLGTGFAGWGRDGTDHQIGPNIDHLN